MINRYEETLYDAYTQAFSVEDIYYESKSEHQHIIIGRVMALDGIIQTTERDEFIYHEMLTHVPIISHGAVGRVLIIGGGDGAMLREACRHDSISDITMVEIDQAVIDLCREHLPAHSRGAFDDPRLNLVISDGAEFVADTGERFDVIIVDSTDPIGPGAVLFTREFYANCKRCLNPRGVLVTQNGVPFVQGDELKSSVAHFRSLFADGTAYVIACPTYALGFMALGWATDDTNMRLQGIETIRARFRALDIDTRYYNPAIHFASFATRLRRRPPGVQPAFR